MPEEIQANGFVVLENLLTPEDLAPVRAFLESRPRTRWRAGQRHLLSHTCVAELAAKPSLVALAAAALGGPATAFRATLFDKSLATNWLVTWHQDVVVPVRERLPASGWGPWSIKAGKHYVRASSAALARLVAVRVHLDDSNDANGPLLVLAGTHRQGVPSNAAIHDRARDLRPKACTTAAGGVVVMRPLLVHASSKARDTARRRVLHIEYASSINLEHGLQLAMA